MLSTPSGLAPRLVLVVALTVGLTSCTHDGDAGSTPTTKTSASDSASTAGTTTLERSDAKLKISIRQMGGGVRKSRRAGITRAIGKPIGKWMDAAYLAGDFPRKKYTAKAFPGWTARAATLARRDKKVTTNAAVGRKIVGVVADERSARLFVFALGGLTGGATARVHLKMTAEKKNGDRMSFAVAGELYLTRKADQWRIFGYDLHRTVLR